AGSMLAAVSAAAIVGYIAGKRAAPATLPSATTRYTVQRVTDLAGIGESPAISPDRKSVAFTAPAYGHRQLCGRLLGGVSRVQITRDATDHQGPGRVPEGDALVYLGPARPG